MIMAREIKWTIVYVTDDTLHHIPVRSWQEAVAGRLRLNETGLEAWIEERGTNMPVETREQATKRLGYLPSW